MATLELHRQMSPLATPSQQRAQLSLVCSQLSPASRPASVRRRPTWGWKWRLRCCSDGWMLLLRWLPRRFVCCAQLRCRSSCTTHVLLQVQRPRRHRLRGMRCWRLQLHTSTPELEQPQLACCFCQHKPPTM